MTMKRSLFFLLASLFSTCMYAYWPVDVDCRPIGRLPHAVMGVVHDDTNIYVAKFDGYLVVINKATGEKTFVETKLGSLEFSPTSLAIYGDKVWIGTLGMGSRIGGRLLKYANGKVSSSGISLNYGNATWGNPPAIENILFDASGNMYAVSTYGYGFYIDTKNKVVNFETNKRSCTGKMCLDKDGTLWISYWGWPTNKYSLARFTKDWESIYFLKEHPDVMHDDNARCLAADKENGIWFHARDRLYRIQNDEVDESYSFSISPRLCDMAFDTDQQLWLAGEHGPLVMMKDGDFTSYPCPIDSKMWMCMDIDGNDIYIGTDEFLLLFRDGEYTKIDLGQPDPQGHQSTGINHTEVSTSTFGIFDLLGRQLQDKPERGVYIQDGRKYVVR